MAGAGYKLFNTGDVLTAAQVNTYLQQQVTMVFADSSARTTALSGVLAEGMMSYLQDTNAVEVYNGSSWVNVGNAGDITEVQAGTGISVASGTGPIPVVTNSMATTIDAKGDLIVGTGADTFGRLAVGTNGYTIVADSTETTGLKWAAASSGGETLITTTEANNTVTSYDFTSLGSYKHLRFVITKLQTTGADNRAIGFQFNNDTAGNYTNYSGRNSIGDTEFNSNNIALAYNTDASSRYGQFVVEIWNYGSSTEYKAIRWYSAVYTNGTAYSSYMLGHWNSTAAITSVKFFSGSNFRLGTFKVYGIS